MTLILHYLKALLVIIASFMVERPWMKLMQVRNY